mmetsp:Transcript_5043/g.18911  ORF Transcript_5043/g.18911 Transcript_5043/m.18911 type:complete len:165 (-) Transcript_5043:3230-3724(-)
MSTTPSRRSPLSYYSSLESYVFFLFFLLHIPISFLLDFQVIFEKYYPQTLIDFNRNAWILPYNDLLLQIQPVWFRAFIFCEILQMVYYVYIVIQWFRRRWHLCRPISLIFASHVATTMVPIISELLFNSDVYPGSSAKHLTLLSVYGLWCLFPTWWLYRNFVGF